MFLNDFFVEQVIYCSFHEILISGLGINERVPNQRCLIIS